MELRLEANLHRAFKVGTKVEWVLPSAKISRRTAASTRFQFHAYIGMLASPLAILPSEAEGMLDLSLYKPILEISRKRVVELCLMASHPRNSSPRVTRDRPNSSLCQPMRQPPCAVLFQVQSIEAAARSSSTTRYCRSRVQTI